MYTLFNNRSEGFSAGVQSPVGSLSHQLKCDARMPDSAVDMMALSFKSSKEQKLGLKSAVLMPLCDVAKNSVNTLAHLVLLPVAALDVAGGGVSGKVFLKDAPSSFVRLGRSVATVFIGISRLFKPRAFDATLLKWSISCLKAENKRCHDVWGEYKPETATMIEDLSSLTDKQKALRAFRRCNSKDLFSTGEDHGYSFKKLTESLKEHEFRYILSELLPNQRYQPGGIRDGDLLVPLNLPDDLFTIYLDELNQRSYERDWKQTLTSRLQEKYKDESLELGGRLQGDRDAFSRKVSD